MKERLFDHIKKKYKVKPEYPWRKYPDFKVYEVSDGKVLSSEVIDTNGTGHGEHGCNHGGCHQ